ncbi:MAG TPA: 30S ribosomal protein S15 [Xanthomarina sp.]|nr:30S ribosomal protein S15 [Xanthomarina sp.]
MQLERKAFIYITIIYNNIRMYLSKEVKEEIFAKHGKGKNDTGTAEGQIALFTYRINHLSGHLKTNRKDFNTERSLVMLVGKRRALLDYLIKKDVLRYRAIVKELGLRK